MNDKRRPLSQSLSINNLHARFSLMKRMSSSNYATSLKSVKSNSSLASKRSVAVSPLTVSTGYTGPTGAVSATSFENVTSTIDKNSHKKQDSDMKTLKKRFSIYGRLPGLEPFVNDIKGSGHDTENNPTTPVSDSIETNSINLNSIDMELTPNTVYDYDVSVDSKKRILNFNVKDFIDIINFDDNNERVMNEEQYIMDFNAEQEYVVKMVESCLFFGYNQSRKEPEDEVYFSDEEIFPEEL